MSIDLSRAQLSDFKFTGREAKLIRSRVGYVFAIPVISKSEEAKKSECIGVVAFATDRARGNTILESETSRAAMTVCAESLSTEVDELGGALKALERAGAFTAVVRKVRQKGRRR